MTEYEELFLGPLAEHLSFPGMNATTSRSLGEKRRLEIYETTYMRKSLSTVYVMFLLTWTSIVFICDSLYARPVAWLTIIISDRYSANLAWCRSVQIACLVMSLLALCLTCCSLITRSAIMILPVTVYLCLQCFTVGMKVFLWCRLDSTIAAIEQRMQWLNAWCGVCSAVGHISRKTIGESEVGRAVSGLQKTLTKTSKCLARKLAPSSSVQPLICNLKIARLDSLKNKLVLCKSQALEYEWLSRQLLDRASIKYILTMIACDFELCSQLISIPLLDMPSMPTENLEGLDVTSNALQRNPKLSEMIAMHAKLYECTERVGMTIKGHKDQTLKFLLDDTAKAMLSLASEFAYNSSSLDDFNRTTLSRVQNETFDDEGEKETVPNSSRSNDARLHESHIDAASNFNEIVMELRRRGHIRSNLTTTDKFTTIFNSDDDDDGIASRSLTSDDGSITRFAFIASSRSSVSLTSSSCGVDCSSRVDIESSHDKKIDVNSNGFNSNDVNSNDVNSNDVNSNDVNSNDVNFSGDNSNGDNFSGGSTDSADERSIASRLSSIIDLNSCLLKGLRARGITDQHNC